MVRTKQNHTGPFTARDEVYAGDINRRLSILWATEWECEQGGMEVKTAENVFRCR